MLITDEYIAQNRQLHEANPEYGTSGIKWARLVMDICAEHGLTTVLDYGCGKGTLKRSVYGVEVREYDPAIPGKDTPPEPADLVVCTDVLEHIEPDCLDGVLDDIKRLTVKSAVLVAATRKAKKTLPDGRNAHLIVQPKEWWEAKVHERFNIAVKGKGEGECLFIVEPKC